jgi:phosphopantetheinyl transferase (holo-ACP synthase)
LYSFTFPFVFPAWLRFRRKDPPTQEELEKNYQIMMMKKANAKRLAEKEATEKALGAGERLPASMSPQEEVIGSLCLKL